MKKLFILLLIPAIGIAQISITSTPETKELIKVYDSTYNYPGKDVSVLKGQNVFVKPKSESLQKFGYDNFVLNPDKSNHVKGNTYKPNSTGYNTEYSNLVGRYFFVENVLGAETYRPKLKLKDTISNEIIYFQYKRYKHAFPFIVEGFFKKLETSMLNKKYIIRTLINPIVFLKEEIKVVPGEEKLWEIVKITIDSKYGNISYVLEDDLSHRILVYKDDFEKKALTEKKYNLMKQLYPIYYKKILQEKVVIGMTELACTVAWGRPKTINTSSSGDQWVYEGSYLYFKDGILTAFN
ncbi:hypothetical protein [Thalassobellus citreus]|uniref:hypothetical protein n=1 Tax=Thalassobellus citreus TaxID=3367752 RepID=UPI0037AAB8C5